MSDQYLGEIRLFGGNFAPDGWALCNGQLLPITQNEALYAIIGTLYGGDGTTNFGLPNLLGRVPMQQGQGAGLSSRIVGEAAGEASVVLTPSQLPPHTHAAAGSTGAGTSNSPASSIWATPHYGRRSDLTYSTAAPSVSMGTLGSTGGNLPHNNMPPYLGVTFIIALSGVFPIRS